MKIHINPIENKQTLKREQGGDLVVIQVLRETEMCLIFQLCAGFRRLHCIFILA